MTLMTMAYLLTPSLRKWCNSASLKLKLKLVELQGPRWGPPMIFSSSFSPVRLQGSWDSVNLKPQKKNNSSESLENFAADRFSITVKSWCAEPIELRWFKQTNRGNTITDVATPAGNNLTIKLKENSGIAINVREEDLTFARIVWLTQGFMSD